MQTFAIRMQIIGGKKMEEKAETSLLKFEEIKKCVRDLEDFTQVRMKNKVNELNEIVDHIQNNWRGSNSEKYKVKINEINEEIDKFRRECLSKIVENIDAQTSQYQNNENS